VVDEGPTGYTALKRSTTIFNCPYKNRSPKCAFASASESVLFSLKNTQACARL